MIVDARFILTSIFLIVSLFLVYDWEACVE